MTTGTAKILTLKRNADQAAHEAKTRWQELGTELVHTTEDIGHNVGEAIAKGRETLSEWKPSTQIGRHPWVALGLAVLVGAYLAPDFKRR